MDRSNTEKGNKKPANSAYLWYTKNALNNFKESNTSKINFNTPITVAKMKEYAKEYCKRLDRLTPPDQPDLDIVDYATEDLIVYIKKEEILRLFDDDNEEIVGLMAIFGLELKTGSTQPKNQTVMLVPYDEDFKAVKIGGIVQGEEQFPGDNVHDMAQIRQNINQKVEDVFDHWDIK